jgi:hypothetical protein
LRVSTATPKRVFPVRANSAKPPLTDRGMIGVDHSPVSLSAKPRTLSMAASAGTGTRAITGVAGGALASRSTVATTRRGV